MCFVLSGFVKFLQETMKKHLGGPNLTRKRTSNRQLSLVGFCPEMIGTPAITKFSEDLQL